MSITTNRTIETMLTIRYDDAISTVVTANIQAFIKGLSDLSFALNNNYVDLVCYPKCPTIRDYDDAEGTSYYTATFVMIHDYPTNIDALDGIEILAKDVIKQIEKLAFQHDISIL